MMRPYEGNARLRVVSVGPPNTNDTNDTNDTSLSRRPGTPSLRAPDKTNKTNKTNKSGVHAQGGLRRALCLGWRWAGVGLEQGWRGRILAHNLIVAGPRTGWAS